MIEKEKIKDLLKDLGTISTIWNDLSVEMQIFLSQCFAGEKDAYIFMGTINKLADK